jgi:uncharacterized protein (TIGR02145 family)
MKKISIFLVSFILLTSWQVIYKNPTTSKEIKEVKIGNQIWMAENLNIDQFRNGDSISEAKTAEEWLNAVKEGKPAWCYYNNSSANGLKYGKLYNIYAVTDSRGLAPVGYHIPDDDEWYSLKRTLDSNDYIFGKKAIKKLKSTTGWKSYESGGPGYKVCPNCSNWNNEYRRKVPCHYCKDTRKVRTIDPIIKHSGNGNNSSGFTALPAGSRRFDGKFDELGTSATWWTGQGDQIHIYLNPFANEYFFTNDMNFDTQNFYGFSVRCIKD